MYEMLIAPFVANKNWLKLIEPIVLSQNVELLQNLV